MHAHVPGVVLFELPDPGLKPHSWSCRLQCFNLPSTCMDVTLFGASFHTAMGLH